MNTPTLATPTLTTSRLVLDRILPTDSDALYGIFSDPRVVQNYDVERFTSPDDAINLIEYFDARMHNGSGMRWAIRLQNSPKLIGSCGFNTWNAYDYTAVLGYELAYSEWGKGYAREAVTAVLEHVFSDQFHFFVNRVEAMILPQNTPSEALARKLGFRKEGTLRGKCYWNGAFHDMNLFGLVRDDWQTQKN